MCRESSKTALHGRHIAQRFRRDADASPRGEVSPPSVPEHRFGGGLRPPYEESQGPREPVPHR